jgi:biopolymer transport protein ExbD
MPKINMPRSAPSIDMTPMVDLAFLLVTFFMLTASFRSDEPVQVNTPSSIGVEEVPQKHLILVTINQGGQAYFHATGEEVRKNMLLTMADKYKVQFTNEQVKKFVATTSFGCPINQLPKYLDLTSEERVEYNKSNPGIPADSSSAGGNQLREWILAGQLAALQAGQAEYEDESSKTSEKLDVKDFKPVFVLKVDGKSQYTHAKRVIDIFRDVNITNLNFVTSLEDNPYKKPE